MRGASSVAPTATAVKPAASAHPAPPVNTVRNLANLFRMLAFFSRMPHPHPGRLLSENAESRYSCSLPAGSASDSELHGGTHDVHPHHPRRHASRTPEREGRQIHPRAAREVS